jgi:DNA-directed RNA polymerase subunit E'/Rpb7
MASNKEIYVRSLLHEKVKLPANKINIHYKKTILEELKAKVEGKCTKHGFIKADTIELHQVQQGIVEMASLNGNIVFDVKFFCDVCNPVTGSVVKCRVSNINKFGILAEVRPVLEIIIAKNSVNIKSDVDLESVSIGDDILVEIVGKKYDIGDTRISIIGRIVTSQSNIKAKRTLKSLQPPLTAPELEEELDSDVDNISDVVEDDDAVSEESESEEDEEQYDDASEEDEDDDNSSIKQGVKKSGGFFDSDVEEDQYDLYGGDEASDVDEDASDFVDEDE